MMILMLYAIKIKIQIERRIIFMKTKKIFAIMGLGIKGGMEVVLKFDGEDEDAAYEKISAFMKENL